MANYPKHAKNLIRKMKKFSSHGATRGDFPVASPSVHWNTSSELPDLAAVVAGTKPAAFVGKPQNKHTAKYMQQVIKAGKAKGMITHSPKGSSSFFFGKRKNVHKGVRMMRDPNVERSIRAPAQFGANLGYPREKTSQFALRNRNYFKVDPSKKRRFDRVVREALIEAILDEIHPYDPRERRYHGTSVKNLASIAKRETALWTTPDVKVARFYSGLPSGEQELLKKGERVKKALIKRGIDPSKGVRKYHVTGSPEVKRHARIPKAERMVLAIGKARPQSAHRSSMERKSMWGYAGDRFSAKPSEINVVGRSGKLTPIRQVAKERLRGIKAGKIKLISRPLPK